MSKHVLDHTHTTNGGRARAYADIERRVSPEGSHPSSQVLHRRAATRDQGGRTEAYTRIERERAARQD